MTLTSRRTLAAVLIGVGCALWFAIGNGRGMGAVRWVMLAAAIVVGAVPPVSVRVGRFLDRIRHPSQRSLERTALLVGVLATAYFIFTAFNQDRDLFPKTHDDSSYLLGMRMLAHGRLWMPQHPLADFFETFYVITKPVYASKYFPGTALMFTPELWLGWPVWVLPVVASGACVGLLYRIITALIDGVAGLLAALLLSSLSWSRMLSVLLYSQVPMLLLGLLIVWAFLRWRANKRIGWLIAVGAFAGWAAITRPVDAVCYALPIGIGIMFELRKAPPRRWTTAGACLFAGAIPFLALQLTFNKGVTGSFTTSPFTYYIERDHPQTTFGFHPFDPTRNAESRLQQKRDYYATVIRPLAQRHQPANVLRQWIGRDVVNQPGYERPRLPMLVDATMPFRVLLPLACAGILGLTGAGRRVLWFPLPLLAGMYVLYTFFLEHYAVTVAPAMILSIVLGIETLAGAWPRFANPIRSSLALGILTLTLLSTYETNRLTTQLDTNDTSRRLHSIDDETFRSATLRTLNTQLGDLVQTPAVVLFRYRTGDEVTQEPVYNNAAAWPDDEPIIRAHDLGDARNVQIVRYYAEKQPERTFYRFDRASGQLTKLGDARSLLNQMTKQ
jgi:hypothetical protein